MALHTHTLSLSAFSAVFNPIPRNSLPILSPSSTLPFPNIHLRSDGVACSSSTRWIPTAKRYNTRRVTRLKSADEETLVPEQEDEQTSSQPEVDGEPSTSENDQEPVVVPVSPADTLTMFFQADGSMSEAAIPALTKALEETEGVTNLKVQVVEGVASVELAKLTTVQATGVASTLVETIQGSGFKLQTLNLSFEDEEVVAV